jgi:hypothetical protein
MTGEGAGRVRIAGRDGAILARGRYVRLAGQLRDAADTAERAAATLADDVAGQGVDLGAAWVSAATIAEAAATLRAAAMLADEKADAAGPRY